MEKERWFICSRPSSVPHRAINNISKPPSVERPDRLKSYSIHASCSLTDACHATQSCSSADQINISPLSQTTMPATTVEEWLDSGQADEPPHRCKKIIKEWATEDGAFITCRADDGTQQTHKLVAMSSLSRRACYSLSIS